jgi:hypothetical protein
MVTCGCRFVDDAGNVREEFGTMSPTLDKEQIWRSLLRAAGIAKPCVVARACAFKQIGVFDTSIPVAADQDMWIRLAMAGEVEFVNDYLTIAHDTPGSLTKTYVKHIDEYVLPMINRHIASRRSDLSREEIRHILGDRFSLIGRNLYRNGSLLRGSWLLLRAIALGEHRSQNLWYLVTASPPARLMKRLIKPRSRTGLPSRHGRTHPAATRSLLAPLERNLVKIPAGPPILIVAVDTEAEFDWSGPRLRTHQSVQSVREQVSLQSMFEKFDIRPTYLVDYAVATQDAGYAPLREVVASASCEIGAHLQTWETPPFDEELGERTSFGQNLPAWLQKEKLVRLTEMINLNMGIRPVAYRAGRYGIGEEIAWILEALGYEIDLSVLPTFDLRGRHGPDFRRAFNQPYWFGRERDLVEIPITVGFSGLLSSGGLFRKFNSSLYNLISRPRLFRAHVPGALARLGLFERIRLTPEGVSLQELKRLTRALLACQHRVFTFSYHSSSLLPGNTPYVRSRKDLSQFVDRMEAFFDFFFAETGGVTMTASEFRVAALDAGSATDIKAGIGS